MQVSGIHHLTAITANVRANKAFYTETLGLRLVKKTVNQDDVSAYHLFYGDGLGSPGTDITFFDWPLERERRGTRSIVRTGLRVAGRGTLAWWKQRFAEAGVPHGVIAEHEGRLTVEFEDPEGQRLGLVDDGGLGTSYPWERSPVPPPYQIRGLGPVAISVSELEPTDGVLTRVLGMTPVQDYPTPGDTQSRTHVYRMGPGGPAAELHVTVAPDSPAARQGAGGVHHVAFRVADADYEAWADRLRERRMPSSGPIDRFYFRSLYFREPNGILFELATDGPGFAADEPVETLGEKLSLPPFLEPRRREIEAGLEPL
jgi:glyoxalase family protein